jgi:cyclopropane fatty-acyl-phospholipid synthase-like methyltransferase
MRQTKAKLAEMLRLEGFPRSAGYDPRWVLENQMGPNVLWLTEALCQVMEFKPGMRVLDMGCGKAISSIFLAREFGVQVWATDLWISASENWERVQAAGVESQVFPIHAEAHTLPFADNFFEAVVSLDAYHYFGTDDLYLGTCFARLVKPGGQIGIVVPGLAQELNDGLPEYLQPGWDWEFCTFHSPAWWQQHWEKTGKVVVELADRIPDGWRHWLKWQEVRQQAGYAYDESEAELVRRDAGRNLGFSRVVARRNG